MWPILSEKILAEIIEEEKAWENELYSERQERKVDSRYKYSTIGFFKGFSVLRPSRAYSVPIVWASSLSLFENTCIGEIFEWCQLVWWMRCKIVFVYVSLLLKSYGVETVLIWSGSGADKAPWVTRSQSGTSGSRTVMFKHSTCITLHHESSMSSSNRCCIACIVAGMFLSIPYVAEVSLVNSIKFCRRCSLALWRTTPS